MLQSIFIRKYVYKNIYVQVTSVFNIIHSYSFQFPFVRKTLCAGCWFYAVFKDFLGDLWSKRFISSCILHVHPSRPAWRTLVQVFQAFCHQVPIENEVNTSRTTNLKLWNSMCLLNPQHFTWSHHGECLKMKQLSMKIVQQKQLSSCLLAGWFLPKKQLKLGCHLHSPLTIHSWSFKNIHITCSIKSATATPIVQTLNNYLQENEIQRSMQGKLSPKRFTEGICVNFDAGLKLIDIDRVGSIDPAASARTHFSDPIFWRKGTCIRNPATMVAKTKNFEVQIWDTMSVLR